MPRASESASARLAQELTKKVRDRGLVLWVDPEHQYDALVDALAQKQFGFEYPVVAFRQLQPRLLTLRRPRASVRKGRAAAVPCPSP
jgi:hypothetical protein